MKASENPINLHIFVSVYISIEPINFIYEFLRMSWATNTRFLLWFWNIFVGNNSQLASGSAYA